MKSPARRAFIFLSASVLLFSVSADSIVPQVHTALGSLRGEYVSVKGTEAGVHAFLGVPFAKPPLGPALRLSAPQPVEGWRGVRDATKQPPMCIQNKRLVVDLMEHLVDMVADIPDVSEDCLYLNIYTPANRAEDSKLPVMVWIHGGGFTIGSASTYDGSALTAYQDVVVVLVQYRLGLLGFLSTGDEHMSGNFGLLDQVEALRWIKQHIHSFGGDPDLVTIFGESAGGVSVSLLLLSPLSDGLFHRAIAESGTAAMDLLVMDDPLPVTQIIANLSGCSNDNTEKLSECMKNLDLDTILRIGEDEKVRYPINTDGHFLKKNADELLRKHELLTVPFMTGVTNHEGGFLLVNFFAPKNWTEGLDLEHIKNMISMFYPNPFITGLMIEEYMGTGEDLVKNRDAYTELLGDMIFTIPAIKAANAHRDAGAAVYLYEYQHPPGLLQAKRPSFVKADHGDELFSVLGLCFTTKHVTLTEGACSEEEKQLSKTVMSYWANFARTGSPNGAGLAHWPKYGAEEHYLKIDLKEQLVDQHLKRDRFVFMTQTLPEKIKQQKEKMEKLPQVHTALGSLRGEYVSVKGTEAGVHAFLGIPFAKPPVGPALRYSAPQPVEGWRGVRDATKQPPMCIQRRESTLELLQKLRGLSVEVPDVSEDCLYLNIYTPANRAEDSKLPVMVWIHGGGFAIGSASIFDGSALASYQDMVVVLVQYRLGLLGFLSTGDEHMSGNFGLLDQVEALRWIKQHIHSFGGDPDLVTIFGESAGGASVSLLLLSPLSDGLFHRAIAESGSAGMDFLFMNDPLPAAQMIANKSGCSIDSTEKFSECMKNLDLDTVLGVVQDETLRYVLNVDGHFLTKPADELLRKHELLTVPFMTGVNNDEGGFLLVEFLLPKNWTEGLDSELAKNMLSLFIPDPIMTDTMIEEYMGTGEDRVKNRNGYTELLGDVLFTVPAIKTANAHRDAGAPVYLYEYRYPPSFLQAQRPSFVGADHSDEIVSVLGYCFTTKHVTLTDECPEEEKQLSKTMMSYWANFARTGSPNGAGLAHWPKYGAEEHYLKIDLKEQLTDQHLKRDRFVFLTQTLPEKIKQQKEKMEKLLEVHTALGSLRGEYVSVKGTEAGVHAFLGVPFAKPPLGPALRLSAPQPVEGWRGVRDATKQPPMCIQENLVTDDVMKHFGVTLGDIPDVSEDCLYLNIYTPAHRAEDSKLPVMFWIHGGGFTFGSASTYDGSALAAYQDMVVVLVQYRLGLLGFLSTGDEHISGNFGLLDQVEALRWVKQHIHNFGGDPDLVTIFGESAGGVSVSLLLLSPLSDGLFHRAIAESGTAAMDLLVMDDPLPAAQMIANKSGCSIDSTEKFSECIKNLDLDTILTVAQIFNVTMSFKDRTLRYPVNVDGHFLTKPVDELFRKHELLPVPFMTGVNNDEGGFLFVNFVAPENWTEGLDLEQIKNIFSEFCPDPIISGLMLEEYMGTGEDRVKNRNGYTELLGDMIFTIPAIKAANAHRDAGVPVYLYEYQHPPSFLQAKRPSFVKADHTDEIFVVLGYCFTTKHVTLIDACPEEEKQLSKTMMSYWANFARTGSPNGAGLAHWPKYGAEEHYLKIDLKEQLVDQHLKRDRFVFLTQTLPEKIKQQKEKMEKLLEVHTALGSLRGEYVSVKGTEAGVHAFLGVPFAKPPLGPALRLSAPQPVEGWRGMRDATKQPPMCIQDKLVTDDLMKHFGVGLGDIPDVSEDCLYLNIYTPANRAEDSKLPVMFWIHGGGFTLGSASTYDGSALAAYQDMVVVLVQYRLGLLGFLSTGDEHISGNFGLLDQVEALRWVKQHIHSFGGDPDLVTIFGESAGGVSVSVLLLSPLSDGLFHRAIAESGTAAMDLLVMDDPLPAAQMIANKSGCSIDSTEKFSECIKNLDLDTILTVAQDKTLRYPVNVDGHFLTKPVDELFRKHELLPVPFMTGANNDEGGFLLVSFFAPENWTEGLDLEQIKNIFSEFCPDPIISGLMFEEYMGTGEDRVKNRNGYTELLGDMIFTIPAIKAANAHRDAGVPVYLYEYQHPPSFLQAKRPSFVKADHGDEICVVLGYCFTTKHVTLTDACPEEEKQLSKTMMSYWANFARTGSPNGAGLAHWPKYGAEEHYLKIDLKEQLVDQHLKRDRFVFLTQTLPEKIKQQKEKMEKLLEVHTALGSLRGEYVSVKGTEAGVHAFLGVPFAKPPLGPALRLSAPQPVEGWRGVRDATKQPPMCIQENLVTDDVMKHFGIGLGDIPDVSEDCLYLNIYTPANRAEDSKLPVMFWIHGGSFTFGSASTYDGSALAAYQDMVVVLVQYRLGLLGFLSTGDEHISGNFGLLDQVEALRWVKQHIHNFGGDPDLVTIFGESAGGVSVSVLLLSPLSDGLFHRAIAESGTAAMDFLVMDDPLPAAQMIANKSGCSIDSTEKFSECIKNLDLDTILTVAQDKTLRYPVNVDGHFLTKPVDELFRKHELLPVPFMTGVNNDEGGFLFVNFVAPENWTEGLDLEQIKNIFSEFYSDPIISGLMFEEYMGTGEDRVKNRNGYTELLGDVLFTVPAIKAANAHRDAGVPVYLYEYQHPPSFLQAKRPSFVKADHGDEIFVVLGYCFTTKHVTLIDACPEEEKQLSKTMMSYWANFARTGSPNGAGLAHWPKYGAEEHYLKIDLKEQSIDQHLKRDRFIFMTQTLPEKIKQQKEKMEHSEL